MSKIIYQVSRVHSDESTRIEYESEIYATAENYFYTLIDKNKNSHLCELIKLNKIIKDGQDVIDTINFKTVVM